MIHGPKHLCERSRFPLKSFSTPDVHNTDSHVKKKVYLHLLRLMMNWFSQADIVHIAQGWQVRATPQILYFIDWLLCLFLY